MVIIGGCFFSSHRKFRRISYEMKGCAPLMNEGMGGVEDRLRTLFLKTLQPHGQILPQGIFAEKESFIRKKVSLFV